MKKPINRNRPWLLYLVGGGIPITLALGTIFRLSTVLITVLLLVMGIIFAAMWLWHMANRQASGDEWWQDDETSGWRGY